MSQLCSSLTLCYPMVAQYTSQLLINVSSNQVLHFIEKKYIAHQNTLASTAGLQCSRCPFEQFVGKQGFQPQGEHELEHEPNKGESNGEADVSRSETFEAKSISFCAGYTVQLSHKLPKISHK